PFVGREAEFATLRAALERAEGGEGALVLLAGEAGAGKTRLVRTLAQEAAGRGMLVLYGSSDAAVTTPYQPLREWVEFLMRVSDPELLAECIGDGADTLVRLVPRLARLVATTSSAPGDPESERFALQSAVSELLTRISHVQPLLV